MRNNGAVVGMFENAKTKLLYTHRYFTAVFTAVAVVQAAVVQAAVVDSGKSNGLRIAWELDL